MPDSPPEDRRQSKKPSGRLTQDERIVQSMTSAYLIVSALIMPFSERAATVIALKSQECADGWLALGKQYGGVYAWLIRFTEGSAIIVFARPHMEILGALGASPGSLGGVMNRVTGSLSGMGPRRPTPMPTPSNVPPVPPVSPSTEPIRSPNGTTNSTSPTLTPEMLAAIRSQMIAQALQQREAGYNPDDVALRPEQNPAIELIPRVAG